MPVNIRRAVLADVGGIARVHVATWRAAYAGILAADFLAQLSEERRGQQWQRYLADADRHAVFVAEDDAGQVVGFAACGPVQTPVEGCTGEVHALYVLPEAQRSGLGRALVAAATDWLRSTGRHTLAIWVLRDNTPARHFYEALGGQLVAEQDIQIGEQTVREVCYRWLDTDALLQLDTTREERP